MSCQIKEVDLNSLPPADEILSKREASFYQMLRFPKRRDEWLGGRFALKEAVCQIVQINQKEVELLPSPTGKPILLLKGETSSMAFSITHSHGWAVAAVSPDIPFLGIDLEKIEHRIDAWAKDFFHPSEITGTGDSFLTALWTQKEAVVKLLGTGLSLNSYDVRCINGKPFFFGAALDVYNQIGAPVITLQTQQRLAGFMFTLACGRSA